MLETLILLKSYRIFDELYSNIRQKILRNHWTSFVGIADHNVWNPIEVLEFVSLIKYATLSCDCIFLEKN